jgi:RHS repeat-associated protein
VLGSFSTRDNEYRGELVEGANEVDWTNADRIVYHFVDPTETTNIPMAGRLEQISDLNSNVVQILWDWTQGIITNVIDTAGGNYQFNYDSNRGLLTNVTFGSWQINFAYDATNRLASRTVTNTSGSYSDLNATWQFRYDTNSLLALIVDPRGYTNALVQYDQYGRKTNEVDAIGRSTGTQYNVPQIWQMLHADAAGFQWVETYDHNGHLLAQSDPLGNTTSYSYDTNGNRTSITSPLGWTTTFSYDNRANVLTRTNAFGEPTTWTYHSFFNKPLTETDALGNTTTYTYDNNSGNLLNQADSLGTLVTYTYTTNGLVKTSQDANNNMSTFTYSSAGFLASKTDPAGNVTAFSRNELGWLLSQTNALSQITSYAYDVNGNVVQIVDPLFRTITKNYDPNGNLTSQSDAQSPPHYTYFYYDPANQKTQTVDRAGAIWYYNYTSRGALQNVTDPLGNTISNAYDNADRLTQVFDPLTNSVSYQNDPDGNRVVTIDKLGQSWPVTYDRLDRVVVKSDPLGNAVQTTYDTVGRIQTITSPNGNPTQHSYDARGRLIKWIDAQGFNWLYAYDSNGNITNITDALNGHYIMAYSNRNERVMEQNQDGFTWHYIYDVLVRLQQQTDPNSRVTTYTYDNGGRVTTKAYSTGRADNTIYDNNNNPTVLTRFVPPALFTTTRLSYDVMDRVSGCIGPFGETIGYSYDPLGRVANLTYPDGNAVTNGYDQLGRLVFQQDWANRHVMYAYDAANRLIRRQYPNGIVQTNTFDTAGHITGLQYQGSSSNSFLIALTYAYDHNGNKSASSEQGTLHWPQPSMHNETSQYTASGRLISKLDSGVASNNYTYAYDAAGNMTNALGSGQGFVFTYDEDNRVTLLNWDLFPLTSKVISNRYDAIGRRISCTVNGTETRYALDLSGDMERVLCDMNGNSQITAHYIYGPDLCYKVDNAGNLTCYHADAQGNIIALTGNGGTNTALYAYTPYGRSLGSTNFQTQVTNSYLFVGSQGVTEDVPDLYFMRARYYSADASAFLSTDPVKHIGPSWRPVAYRYGESNPLSYNDPNGRFALIDTLVAAGVGAAIGAGVDVFTQAVLEHQPINLHEVAGAAASGAVQGALATFGVVGAPAGAIGGAVGEIVEEASYAKNISQIPSEINLSSVAKATAAGAILGQVSESISDNLAENLIPNGVGRPVDDPFASLVSNSGFSPNAATAFNQQIASSAIDIPIDYDISQTFKLGSQSLSSDISKSLSALTPAANLTAMIGNSGQATKGSSPTMGSGATSGSSGRGGAGNPISIAVQDAPVKTTTALQCVVPSSSPPPNTVVRKGHPL